MGKVACQLETRIIAVVVDNIAAITSWKE